MFDITNWIHSFFGAIHFFAAIIGLVTGTYALISKKGTKRHKLIGYIFAISLVLVNISALFIFDFNSGKFSVFHALIPVSLVCLIYGLLPMFKKKRKDDWQRKHIKGMTGAVLGLWAAGVTEYFVREIADGLSKNELILYTFLIAIPFVLLMAFVITYYIHYKKI